MNQSGSGWILACSIGLRNGTTPVSRRRTGPGSVALRRSAKAATSSDELSSTASTIIRLWKAHDEGRDSCGHSAYRHRERLRDSDLAPCGECACEDFQSEDADDPLDKS